MNESKNNIFHNKRGNVWVRALPGKVKTLTPRFCRLRIGKTLDVVLGGDAIA